MEWEYRHTLFVQPRIPVAVEGMSAPSLLRIVAFVRFFTAPENVVRLRRAETRALELLEEEGDVSQAQP